MSTSTLKSNPVSLSPTPSPAPAAATLPGVNKNRDSSIVNLYFLLLFMLALFIAVVYYFIRRRRREKSARSRSRRHNALVRDLAGWPGANGSRMGGWRGLGSPLGRGSTEEGLDERGEAPPPYESPPFVLPPDYQQESVRHEQLRTGYDAVQVEASQLAIPMPVLTHDTRTQPPGYAEAFSDVNPARPDTRMST